MSEPRKEHLYSQVLMKTCVQSNEISYTTLNKQTNNLKLKSDLRNQS